MVLGTIEKKYLKSIMLKCYLPSSTLFCTNNPQIGNHYQFLCIFTYFLCISTCKYEYTCLFFTEILHICTLPSSIINLLLNVFIVYQNVCM